MNPTRPRHRVMPSLHAQSVSSRLAAPRPGSWTTRTQPEAPAPPDPNLLNMAVALNYDPSGGLRTVYGGTAHPEQVARRRAANKRARAARRVRRRR